MRDRDRRHLLILGGTQEAAQLAQKASELFADRLIVTSSLAGRTRNPAELPGHVRSGGFGGAEGLAKWMTDNGVDFLIDATHPFAQQISANARRACDTANIQRLILYRSPWRASAGDNWRHASSLETAAALLRDMGGRAFLSVGSAHLDAFAGLQDLHLVVRMIDKPETPLPLSRYSIVVGKGPFDVAAEQELLAQERITVVVSRNGGSAATYAKIKAANLLNIPIVMVTSPAREAGACVTSVKDAIQWIAERFIRGEEAIP